VSGVGHESLLSIQYKDAITGREVAAGMMKTKNNYMSRFVGPLASIKLTVILLLLSGLLVIGGTTYQAKNGIYAAQTEVFGSWLVWLFGILPLPGMLLVAGLLFANLLAAAIFRFKYRWPRIGLLLIHYGLLLLVGGGFFIAATAQEYTLTLREGESSHVALLGGGEEESVLSGLPRQVPLPVEIKLIDFEKRMHPGTDIPRSFASRVEITAAGVRRQAVISMNRPLRYRDYTFYQSSYSEDANGRESSTLSVVHNAGRWLPYIASILIFLGLACHFLIMLAAALRRPAS
jgi:hypothetical protein